jgi:hypothetical protein
LFCLLAKNSASLALSIRAAMSVSCVSHVRTNRMVHKHQTYELRSRSLGPSSDKGESGFWMSGTEMGGGVVIVVDGGEVVLLANTCSFSGTLLT